MSKKTFWIFISFVLLVILLRAPAFDIPLDADSGANAFFARQMIRGEILYDRFHPAHHLPGIYYTFVTAFRLFGDNPIAPKLLLLPFVIAGVWLIYLTGHMFYNDLTGLLGAFFLALASSLSYLDGMTVQMELFANLPLVGTVFLLFFLLRKRAPAIQFVWVGVLGAVSVLYKVIFVAPLIVSCLSILLVFWLERFQVDSLKRLFFRLIWVFVGVLLPLIYVGGYFASHGLWERLLLVFTLGFNYFGDQATLGDLKFSRPFGFPLFMLSWNNIALLILSMLGAYKLLRRSFPVQSNENIIDVALVTWLVTSIALTGLRGAGYPHYILTTLPPLALVAAVEINLNYERWKMTSPIRRVRLSVGLMIGLVVSLFFVSNMDLYRAYFPYKMGYISYQEFSSRILSFSIRDIKPVADYVAAHTTKYDFIYVWSKSMQLYYGADRIPPIDIIWTSYVSATGSPGRIFNIHTKYIIVSESDKFPRPQWLIDGLARNYVLETIIDDHEIYRRVTP